MPEGKYYRIRSRLNPANVLDVSGGECSPGATVVTWGAKDEEYDNQLWRSDPLTHTIRSKANEEFCLDIDGDNTLVVNPYSDSESQKLKISGDRILKHTDPTVCLDIAKMDDGEGARVIAYDFKGSDNQLWDIECEAPKYFFIRSAMNDKVLDVFGACPDEGTRVCCYGKKDDPEDNQLWYEDRHGYVRSKLNNMIIDAAGESICLNPHDSGSDRQRWAFGPDNCLTNVDRPEEVLDIKARCEDDGACVIAYSRNGNDNQEWHADYVDL